jgi:hypothetical protein
MWVTDSRVQVVGIKNNQGAKISFMVPYQIDRFSLFLAMRDGVVYLSCKGEVKYQLSIERPDDTSNYFEWKFDETNDITTTCYLKEIVCHEVYENLTTFELI